MAHPRRRDADSARTSFPVPSMPGIVGDRTGYRPGGQVRQMQVDLAYRLGLENAAREPASLSAGERGVRSLSIAGGFIGLLAAYAGAIFLVAH